MNNYDKVIEIFNDFQQSFDANFKLYKDEIKPNLEKFEKIFILNNYIPHISIDKIDNFVEESVNLTEIPRTYLIKFDNKEYNGYNNGSNNDWAKIYINSIESSIIKKTLCLGDEVKLYFDINYKNKLSNNVNDGIGLIDDNNCKQDFYHNNKTCKSTIYTNFNFVININYHNICKSAKYSDRERRNINTTYFEPILIGNNLKFKTSNVVCPSQCKFPCTYYCNLKCPCKFFPLENIIINDEFWTKNKNDYSSTKFWNDSNNHSVDKYVEILNCPEIKHVPEYMKNSNNPDYSYLQGYNYNYYNPDTKEKYKTRDLLNKGIKLKIKFDSKNITINEIKIINSVEFVNTDTMEKIVFEDNIDEEKLNIFLNKCKKEYHPKIILDYLNSRPLDEIKEFFNQIENYNKFSNESDLLNKENKIKLLEIQLEENQEKLQFFTNKTRYEINELNEQLNSIQIDNNNYVKEINKIKKENVLLNKKFNNLDKLYNDLLSQED